MENISLFSATCLYVCNCHRSRHRKPTLHVRWRVVHSLFESVAQVALIVLRQAEAAAPERLGKAFLLQTELGSSASEPLANF